LLYKNFFKDLKSFGMSTQSQWSVNCYYLDFLEARIFVTYVELETLAQV